jgi:allophanate hydrolase subunit 1
MPDSKSSTRIFFRLSNELAERLDELLPELREETMGEVSDRSKAARYLLIEALRERLRQADRRTLIDEALQALDEESSEKEAASG